MALLNETQLRTLANARSWRTRDSINESFQKSINSSAAKAKFDIFLSHSYLDKELILGITEYLEEIGYQVYVDWRQDSHLNRENVTKETAEIVRGRITQSKCLFYATTDAAKESRWMPWELGYMDGQNGKSAILPISHSSNTGNGYAGQEYLGIYPYITSENDTQQRKRLWVRKDAETYVVLEEWLQGKQPHKRT